MTINTNYVEFSLLIDKLMKVKNLEDIEIFVEKIFLSSINKEEISIVKSGYVYRPNTALVAKLKN